MDQIKKIFTAEVQQQVKEAIQEAEKNTSGEIRLHVDTRCKIAVLDRAAFIFEKLQMHQTELRNGILFYLAIKDHKFAILGDAGINAKVDDGFWDDVNGIVLNHFKKGEFGQGLCEGILKAGDKLKEHFPYQSDDVNELSDDISFGN